MTTGGEDIKEGLRQVASSLDSLTVAIAGTGPVIITASTKRIMDPPDAAHVTVDAAWEAWKAAYLREDWTGPSEAERLAFYAGWSAADDD